MTYHGVSINEKKFRDDLENGSYDAQYLLEYMWNITIKHVQANRGSITARTLECLDKYIEKSA